MPVERCPWCGAKQNRHCPETWDCGTERLEVAVQTTQCVRHQLFDAQARVTRLESALRTIADTHGPGTIAGDAARNALRADA